MLVAIGKRKDGRYYPKSGANAENGMSRKMFDELRKQDARRSPTARATDNRIKAPIDKEGTRWHKRPNRFDVKGIDYPKPKYIRLKNGMLWPVDDDAQIIR